MEAEVIDAAAVAGGLRLSDAQQDSLSLIFHGADGSDYRFRPLSKAPRAMLGAALVETFSDDILHDLVATVHPFTPLLTSPLLEAAGIPAPRPRFVLFREMPQGGVRGGLFTGKPGFLQKVPAAASGLLSTEELMEELEHDPAQQVDALAYLTMRIMDLYFGDADRAPRRWLWSNDGDRMCARWRPVPTDRTTPFSRFDGIALLGTAVAVPALAGWGEEYAPVAKTAWTARLLDRRFLSWLGKQQWDSVCAAIVSRLSDSVFVEAVGTLPAALREQGGQNLFRLLRQRRDALPGVVEEYYRLLADVVDLRLSGAAEVVEVKMDGERGVLVSVMPKTDGDVQSANPPCLNRLFCAGETEEVRIYLGGGEDSVHQKAHGSDVLVRIVHAGEEDVGRWGVAAAAGALGIAADPLEDRGASWGVEGIFDWREQLGPIAGIGPVYTRYGFQKDPYAYRLSLVGGYAPLANVGKLMIGADVRTFLPGTSVTLSAVASGYELLNYFGPGNERKLPRDPNSDYFRVRQSQYRVDAGVRAPAAGPVSVFLGGTLRFVHTKPDGERYLGVVQPYGVEDLFFGGITAWVRVDTRDLAAHPLGGLFLELGGTYWPAGSRLREGFGRVRGDVRWFVTPDTDNVLTLSLRCAGERVIGKTPYFESAFLGGYDNLRGYQQARFAGDASLFAGIEARVRLGTLNILVPATFGVLGFAETGRVFVRGEESRLWHPSFGGGAWLAPWSRRATVSGWIGFSQESTLAYVSLGFGF